MRLCYNLKNYKITHLHNHYNATSKETYQRQPPHQTTQNQARRKWFSSAYRKAAKKVKEFKFQVTRQPSPKAWTTLGKLLAVLYRGHILKVD